MKIRNPVVWFEIYVNDIKMARKFYEEVLKVEMKEMPMPAVDGTMQMLSFPMEMDGEGATGALVKMEGFKSGGNSTLIYFASDDCSIEEGRVEDAGGKIIQTKKSLGEYGFMVLAQDPEGNMFGIHSQS